MTEANWEIDVKKRNVCATCKHFKRKGDTQEGLCRRYPPTIFSIDDFREIDWPMVRESDGCGEYARF